jgi:hypothetical protein
MLIGHHYVHNFEHQLSSAGIDGGLALASFGTTPGVWIYDRHLLSEPPHGRVVLGVVGTVRYGSALPGSF